MVKTIKELAEELGVTKTTIRNYMDADFRAKYTAKDHKGVITISESGCEKIAQSLGNEPQNRKDEAEKIAGTENVTIPRSVLTMLETQLREKDAQLAAKDRQIEDLTATVRNQSQSLQGAQALHAGTMKQMLPEGEAAATVEADSEPSEHKQRWQWLPWNKKKGN